MNKRGISPLIATLLLISFAVAIGLTVMNFGRAQVELEAQCPIEIDLRLISFKGTPDLCYNAGKKELVFTAENGINIKVEGLLVNVVGTEKAENFEFNDAKMSLGGTYVGYLPYDSSVSGEIRQVRIIPKVVYYDEEQICNKKGIVVEEVKSC